MREREGGREREGEGGRGRGREGEVFKLDGHRCSFVDAHTCQRYSSDLRKFFFRQNNLQVIKHGCSRISIIRNLLEFFCPTIQSVSS